MTRPPHPFARFIQILGRGKTLSRSLTIEEAEEAMAMILAGDVLPEQLGAFLMLLRMKEESPEEIAGFVRAARAAMRLPSPLPKVDLDWSCYAGKRRQLPWYILSALMLARNGTKIFMHGADGHTEGRIFTREVLESLRIPVAWSFEEAAAHLARRNFAYMPLEAINPILANLFGLRSILGLRSPVHTLVAHAQSLCGAGHAARHLPSRLYGHPSEGRAAARTASHAVFRGEGGEIERRPNKPCEVLTVHDGAFW